MADTLRPLQPEIKADAIHYQQDTSCVRVGFMIVIISMLKYLSSSTIHIVFWLAPLTGENPLSSLFVFNDHLNLSVENQYMRFPAHTSQ